MKFSVILAFVAAATVVSAETNAQRMARGLPPNSPARRATPVQRGEKNKPSGTPGGGQCNTGDVMCCDSFEETSSHGNNKVDKLLDDLNHSVSAGTNCGLSCSPITVVGTGSGASCKSQPVCCEDNTYNGIINIGCSPVNIDA